MFRGINAITVDSKGRMAMPARYRTRLQDEASSQLVVTIDAEEKCLLLYPLPAWETIETKIGELSSFNQITRRIQRLLIGHATEVEMDSQGRILLPPLLREYASVEKQAMLLGQGKKFELWDEKSWQERRDSWLSEQGDTQTMPAELQQLSL